MMASLFSEASHRPLGQLGEDELEDIRSAINVTASGTIFPWAYGGHHRTIFGIHFEDAWLPSANLHIAGAPKVWIFIRKDDFEKLRGLVDSTSSRRGV
jgi:hypothetical protein